MKISYFTSSNKSLCIQISENKYELYPNESINIEDINKNNIIQITTQKEKKVGIGRLILLFLGRLFVNVLNVVFMNFSDEWFDELDPFQLSARYETDSQEIEIKYQVPKIFKSVKHIRNPQLLINNEVVNADFNFDINSVSRAFAKTVFDLVSLWSYSALIISLVFVFSGKFFSLLLLYLLILSAITLPVILKIIKVHKEKKRICFLSGMKK